MSQHTYLTVFFLAFGAMAAEPIKGIDAHKHVGEETTVEFTVKSSGSSRKENFTFLNSEENFRALTNFCVIFEPDTIKKFNKAGITDVENHFIRKIVRVTGTIRHFKSVTDMKITDPSQIVIVGTYEPEVKIEKIPQTVENPVIAPSMYSYLGIGIAIGGAAVLLLRFVFGRRATDDSAE